MFYLYFVQLAMLILFNNKIQNKIPIKTYNQYR